MVRYHSTPRATRFSPEAVKGIPVEISNLEQKRKTIGECIYGLNLYEDEDLWQGDINPAEEPFALPWYGQTRFDLKEAVPVSAKAEAAKAKPKAKSRPVLNPVPEEAMESQQHDIAEFATHIFQKLRMPALQGTWQARALDGEVRDIGDTNSPIVVQVDGCTTLQSCVSCWSGQPFCHALTEAPRILCAQLERFTKTRSRITKNFHPIIPGAVMIPVFSGPGAETHPVLCQVAAVALHRGATPTSGHYRCVFFPNGCAVNTEPGCERLCLDGCFITDDGEVAVPLGLNPTVDDVCSSCYFCWLVRM